MPPPTLCGSEEDRITTGRPSNRRRGIHIPGTAGDAPRTLPVPKRQAIGHRVTTADVGRETGDRRAVRAVARCVVGPGGIVGERLDASRLELQLGERERLIRSLA